MSLHKIGPRVADRLKTGLCGGPHNMRGTKTDYMNFSHEIRKFIGDMDAKMFVEMLDQWSVNFPNFLSEYSVVDGELRCAFWADAVSKANYKEFGDVMSFDATYHTNKYDMIFVSFTGVDHHKRGVTFGAGLLSKEFI
ncbi:hypothetical protein E3N88_28845 [Mikania micrantha]|uniref:MULE transposase domain-containing protein n=1 Tax=Mikania micrantha TaxID=192012 RepID=A0A5N6N296_9ASTR|nr:hypothetical protein E3N88_28845 [Mikania micrantha]